MSGLLELVEFRPVVKEDLPFVMSSWLRSLRPHAEWASSEAFFDVHRRVIEGLLQRTHVTVAVQKDDPNVIVGWVAQDAFAPHVVHYVYVKRAFRLCGVAKALVKVDGPMVATHKPPSALADKLCANGWRIRPTAAFYMGLETR